MNRYIWNAFVAAVLCALSNSVLASPPWYSDKSLPSVEAACKKIGGQWTKMPLFQKPYCSISYPDGGKKCNQAGDCQSHICVVNSPNEHSGICHGTAEKDGAFWYIDENGKLGEISVE